MCSSWHAFRSDWQSTQGIDPDGTTIVTGREDSDCMFWKNKTEELFDRAVNYQQGREFDTCCCSTMRFSQLTRGLRTHGLTRARFFGLAGVHEEAIACFQRALALAQSRKEVIFRSIGMIEHIRGNLESAISFHRTAIEE